jgi:SAM-dependent methyltransferase
MILFVASTALFLPAAQVAPSQDRHPLTQRQIAEVMGMGGASWLERPERESEEAPEKALDAIGIEPGMIIADVGAGTGYFARRMARRTGPKGKVFAVDIQPRMLELLKKYAEREGLSNVETIVGKENDPLLPEGKIDLILMVDVYHEFAQPQTMLRKMKAALSPGGRMALLEYRKEDPEVPIRLVHKMSIDEVKTEIEAEGFRLDKVIHTLPRQHILIFVAAPGRLR